MLCLLPGVARSDDVAKSRRNVPSVKPVTVVPPRGALDNGLHTFVWLDALTQKVGEGGRIISVHVLVATAGNADGRREILALEVTSAEDGAGWLAFLRGLVAHGLSGVQLVISDCYAGLMAAVGAYPHRPPGRPSTAKTVRDLVMRLARRTRLGATSASTALARHRGAWA